MTTIQAPRLSERDITTQIKGYLETEGWEPIRLQTGMVRGMTRGTPIRLGKKGQPDWVFVRRSMAIFVEMKAPGKELSTDQERWFEDARRKKLIALWADGLGVFINKYREIVGSA